jgi:hypothetical protein
MGLRLFNVHGLGLIEAREYEEAIVVVHISVWSADVWVCLWYAREAESHQHATGILEDDR